LVIIGSKVTCIWDPVEYVFINVRPWRREHFISQFTHIFMMQLLYGADANMTVTANENVTKQKL